MRVGLASGVLLTIVLLLNFEEFSGSPAQNCGGYQNEEVWEVILHAFKVDASSPSYLSRGNLIFEVPNETDSIAISPNSDMRSVLEYSDSENTVAENIAASMSVSGSYGAFSGAAKMSVSTSYNKNTKTVRMDAVTKAIKYEVASKGSLRTFPERHLTSNFKYSVNTLSVEQIEKNIGVFYALKLDLGGEIRTSYTMQATSSDTESSIGAELRASYGSSLMKVGVSASAKTRNRKSNKNAGMKIERSAHGGRSSIWLGHDFSDKDSDLKVNEVQAEWGASIDDTNLFAFNFELGLVWDLVKKVNMEKGIEFEKYLKAKWENNKNAFRPTSFLTDNHKPITAIGFKVHNSKNSGGKDTSYRMTITQGEDISCKTDVGTWWDPEKNTNQYKNGPNGCYALFDNSQYAPEIKVILEPDTGDYLWIDNIGVYVGGVRFMKSWPTYSDPIYKGGVGEFSRGYALHRG